MNRKKLQKINESSIKDEVCMQNKSGIIYAQVLHNRKIVVPIGISSSQLMKMVKKTNSKHLVSYRHLLKSQRIVYFRGKVHTAVYVTAGDITNRPSKPPIRPIRH